MNTAPQSSASGDADLQWLAFRYIAGEMTAEETAAFEQQMQTDLAACEAVAAQVELSETVLAATRLQPVTTAGPVASGRNAWKWSYLAAVATAVAACLLAFVAGGWLAENNTGDTPEIAQPAAADAVSPELATQWSNARHDLKEAWLHPLPADPPAVDETLEAIAGIDEDSDDQNSDDAVADDYGAPSWMLAAVAVQPAQPGEEELEN